uniref:Uncharacterized protein n=1 Tax=viral metagenome TaxID=1070528 RepID=A0A6H1ZPS3_9ZZZZ
MADEDAYWSGGRAISSDFEAYWVGGHIYPPTKYTMRAAEAIFRGVTVYGI